MIYCVGTIFDFTSLLEFAELGVYCQFDLFGTECSHYQLNPTAYMPSDYQRIDNIIKLSKEGFTNRLLISHDIHTKHRLVSFDYVAMDKKYKKIVFLCRLDSEAMDTLI